MAKWNTPQGFLDGTLGKSYDMDGMYGRTCWDYMDYFWVQQAGRTLSTGGTGEARGCWSVASARKANAGTDFTLITSKSQLKVGDVVVLNGGKFGHIGMVEEIKTAGVKIRLQGQNQGVVRTKVTRVDCGLSDFLGAFRFKAWNTGKQGFLPLKGYWARGDDDPRIGELSAFMFKTFPVYTDKQALGNYFGKFLEMSIKEFQRRVRIKADGMVGPITYDKLKQFGFKG